MARFRLLFKRQKTDFYNVTWVIRYMRRSKQKTVYKIKLRFCSNLDQHCCRGGSGTLAVAEDFGY